ncbi:MAG: SRPBCC family protein [Actinomycetota bacterium]
MSRRVEISRDIAASPADVYAAISDVTRMGEWSIECHHCEWTDGSTSPVVGATFEGHNRNGDNEWITQGKVVAADPGRAFAFQCSMYDFHYSTWGYNIEATEHGSRVTEWADDFRPDEALEMSAKISGIDDRTERNRETISGTLERLAAALEA